MGLLFVLMVVLSTMVHFVGQWEITSQFLHFRPNAARLFVLVGEEKEKGGLTLIKYDRTFFVWFWGSLSSVQITFLAFMVLAFLSHMTAVRVFMVAFEKMESLED